MTLGPLFTTSAINVARAAVRQAEAGMPLDSPNEITVGSHDPADSSRVHVAVTGPDGHVHEIAIDPAAVRACIEAPSGAGASQRLVDNVAGKIAEAMR